LKAVYSRSEHSAQALADAAATQLHLDHTLPVYHDADPAANLNALLARQDIHAVVIALPITVQPSIVLACLQAGKHVLSEKPVAPDVKQGLDLIRTYRSQYQPKGLVWRVAENFEAEPVYQAAAALIKQGRIGKVCFFKVSDVKYIDEDSQWYKTPWRTIPDVSSKQISLCCLHSDHARYF
jgi:predicted dehydrogenase